jgi:hypothetical protein
MPNPLQLVAVQATKKAFYGLRHEPSGSPLQEDGSGIWPADQYTFRLRDDGAIELLTDEAQRVRATAVDDGAEVKAHSEALKSVEADQSTARKHKG